MPKISYYEQPYDFTVLGTVERYKFPVTVVHSRDHKEVGIAYEII